MRQHVAMQAKLDRTLKQNAAPAATSAGGGGGQLQPTFKAALRRLLNFAGANRSSTGEEERAALERRWRRKRL